MEILLCIDGSDSSLLSAELISKLKFPATTKIVALGVSEKNADIQKINNSMDLLEKKISGKYSLTRKIRAGNPYEEILTEAVEHAYDLVAVGGGGQLGILHPALGSTAGQLARKLRTHFLIARQIPENINNILVCAGAEAAPSETMSLGGAWIAHTEAQVELLHVVRPPAPVKGAGNHPEGISTSEKAREDRLLERASRQLRSAGVIAKITPRIRRGVVVEQVLDELSEGRFDLMVIGAHYQPGQDQWQVALFDDITDQLLNRSTCSVLIV